MVGLLVGLSALAGLVGWKIYSEEKKGSPSKASLEVGKLNLQQGALYQVNFYVPTGQAIMLGTTNWQPQGAAPQKISSGVPLPVAVASSSTAKLADGYTMQATWTGQTGVWYDVNPAVRGGNILSSVTLIVPPKPATAPAAAPAPTTSGIQFVGCS